MKLVIDTTEKTLTQEDATGVRVIDLYSKEAFEAISPQWLKIGWALKYSYTFTWLGRPCVQLPEDMIRAQEVIYRVQPDVIIETGIAHGGSLIFYASLCQAMGRGRVVGIDIEIRPRNRQALESHQLGPFITLIEGSSTAPKTVQAAHSLVQPGESVMVILDSNHTKQHVADELEAYCDLVTPNSYIVATDGAMKDLDDVPGGESHWRSDNPAAAAAEFAARHAEFVLEQPAWTFSESELTENVTYWPSAWLRRL